MSAWVFVVGVLVVLVAALLAVDWFTAGRTKGRMLVRARDGGATDANTNYGVIEQSLHNIQHQDPNP
jgi:hypothetical protein